MKPIIECANPLYNTIETLNLRTNFITHEAVLQRLLHHKQKKHYE